MLSLVRCLENFTQTTNKLHVVTILRVRRYKYSIMNFKFMIPCIISVY